METKTTIPFSVLISDFKQEQIDEFLEDLKYLCEQEYRQKKRKTLRKSIQITIMSEEHYMHCRFCEEMNYKYEPTLNYSAHSCLEDRIGLKALKVLLNKYHGKRVYINLQAPNHNISITLKIMHDLENGMPAKEIASKYGKPSNYISALKSRIKKRNS